MFSILKWNVFQQKLKFKISMIEEKTEKLIPHHKIMKSNNYISHF